MSSRKCVPVQYRGKITDQQWIFCAEYLASPDMDGPTAARLAGYKNPVHAASTLLRKPHIQEVIATAIEERSKQCDLEKSKVLKHLCNALYLDPIDIFENPSPGVWKTRDLRDIPEQVRRCITSIKVKSKNRMDSEGNEITESWVEVTLMDKNQCLSMAMKHLGLIEPDPRININVQGDLLVKLLGQAAEESGNVVDGNVIRRLAEG